MTKETARSRRYQRQNVANGLCMVCPLPRVNANHCAKHREQHNALQKRSYDRQKEALMNNPNYVRDRYKRLVNAHRCVKCAEKLPQSWSARRCPACAEEHRADTNTARLAYQKTVVVKPEPAELAAPKTIDMTGRCPKCWLTLPCGGHASIEFYASQRRGE